MIWRKPNWCNTRLNFTDKNGDGKVAITTTTTNEILSESHYYPFGMAMSGPWMDDASARDNQYKYNGKELNEDFGLGWYDYGARWYDASLGRFPNLDPLIDTFPRFSPYNYGGNNPVRFIDFLGMGPEDPPTSRTTTEIKQTFTFDKTVKGTKMETGTDKLTKSVIAQSRGTSGEIRTTIVTTLTVNASGVISPNAEMRAWTESGTGENFTRSGEATAVIPLENVDQDLKSSAQEVAVYKGKKGESNLQTTAKRASTVVDVTAGAIAAVSTSVLVGEGIGAGVGLLTPNSISPEILHKTHKYKVE